MKMKAVKKACCTVDKLGGNRAKERRANTNRVRYRNRGGSMEEVLSSEEANTL